MSTSLSFVNKVTLLSTCFLPTYRLDWFTKLPAPTLVLWITQFLQQWLQWTGHSATWPMKPSLGDNMHQTPSSIAHLEITVCNSSSILSFFSIIVYTAQCSLVNIYTHILRIFFFNFQNFFAYWSLQIHSECFVDVGHMFLTPWH